jgi:hypothetical protein
VRSTEEEHRRRYRRKAEGKKSVRQNVQEAIFEESWATSKILKNNR